MYFFLILPQLYVKLQSHLCGNPRFVLEILNYRENQKKPLFLKMYLQYLSYH